MADKFDYKKEYKDLYLPGKAPALVHVPAMQFIMVDGRGNPNEEGGDYQQAIGLLYALAWTIKMSKTSHAPQGYFEYVMPPLEGLWWMENCDTPDFLHKDRFCWTSMLRQPEFVTPEIFAWAQAEAAAKKGLDTGAARLCAWEEGVCVQCMHQGAYDEEPATLAKINAYLTANGWDPDIGPTRRHHEIYLGDPRRVAPEKRRTVLRVPVRRSV